MTTFAEMGPWTRDSTGFHRILTGGWNMRVKMHEEFVLRRQTSVSPPREFARYANGRVIARLPRLFH